MTLNLKPLIIGFFVIVVLMAMGAIGATLSAGNIFSPLTQAQADQVNATTAQIVRTLQLDNDQKEALNAEDLARQQSITAALTRLVTFGTWIGYTLQLSSGIALNTIFLSLGLAALVLLAWLILHVYQQSQKAIVTPIDAGLKEIKSNARGMVIYTGTGQQTPTYQTTAPNELQATVEITRTIATAMSQTARENNAVDLFISLLDRLPAPVRKSLAPTFYRTVGQPDPLPHPTPPQES